MYCVGISLCSKSRANLVYPLNKAQKVNPYGPGEIKSMSTNTKGTVRFAGRMDWTISSVNTFSQYIYTKAAWGEQKHMASCLQHTNSPNYHFTHWSQGLSIKTELVSVIELQCVLLSGRERLTVYVQTCQAAPFHPNNRQLSQDKMISGTTAQMESVIFPFYNSSKINNIK